MSCAVSPVNTARHRPRQRSIVSSCESAASEPEPSSCSQRSNIAAALLHSSASLLTPPGLQAATSRSKERARILGPCDRRRLGLAGGRLLGRGLAVAVRDRVAVARLRVVAELVD